MILEWKLKRPGSCDMGLQRESKTPTCRRKMIRAVHDLVSLILDATSKFKVFCFYKKNTYRQGRLSSSWPVAVPTSVPIRLPCGWSQFWTHTNCLRLDRWWCTSFRRSASSSIPSSRSCCESRQSPRCPANLLESDTVSTRLYWWTIWA